jgi:hypothetical protein
LALTDPDFKFPQLWRSNVGVDHQLPWLGLIGTAEFLYSRDVNGIYYINANLPAAQTNFSGVDNRPRWTSNRINNAAGNQVSNAIVLKNQNEGYSWNFTAALERPFTRGLFAKVAYSYGEAKNTIGPGSIASGSYFGNAMSGDPNNPGLGFASTSAGSRVLAALSYQKEYFNFGATTVSLFWEGYSLGRASYTFSGDLNGDGGTANDLIYIPRDVSEMNFEEFTSSGATFTAAQQAAAWDAFINQDEYLSANRGKYAERNGVKLPMVFRADLSITQDLFANVFEKRNTLQFRVDFLNITNLLNSDWGVGQRLLAPTPLTARGVDAQGRALYRLRNTGTQLISKSLEYTSGTADVFKILFSFRYNCN